RYRSIGIKMILGNIDRLECRFGDGADTILDRHGVYKAARPVKPQNRYSRNPIDHSFVDLATVLRKIQDTLNHMEVCNVVGVGGGFRIEDIRPATTEGLLPEFIDLLRERGLLE
ncbi:hypothetical protein PFISCL1PPCAC_11810, partial [Pristionchus fissidentatus]